MAISHLKTRHEYITRKLKMNSTHLLQPAGDHAVIWLDFDNCFANDIVRYMLTDFCLDCGEYFIKADQNNTPISQDEMNKIYITLDLLKKTEWYDNLNELTESLLIRVINIIKNKSHLFDFYKVPVEDAHQKNSKNLKLPVNFKVDDIEYKKLNYTERSLLFTAFLRYYVPSVDKFASPIIDEIFWMGNQKLTEWIASLHAKFKRCSVMCFSMRQSLGIDEHNIMLNGMGSAFPRIQTYTQRLAAEFSNQENLKHFLPQYIPFLMPDAFHDLPPGATLGRILIKERTPRHYLDKYKRDMAYAFSHFLMKNSHPQDKTTCFVVDDTPDVHLSINQFFNDSFYLLPLNSSISFIPYQNGEFMCPFNMESLEVNVPRNFYFFKINGLGQVDQSLSGSLKLFAMKSGCQFGDELSYDASKLSVEFKKQFLLDRCQLIKSSVATLFNHYNHSNIHEFQHRENVAVEMLISLRVFTQ